MVGQQCSSLMLHKGGMC